jgi:hypothetical protein
VKTDLYAVGLVLAKRWSAGPPTENGRRIRRAPPRASAALALVGDVDPRLEAIVLALLARKPEDRRHPPPRWWAASRTRAADSTNTGRRLARKGQARRASFAALATVAAMALAYVAADRLQVEATPIARSPSNSPTPPARA